MCDRHYPKIPLVVEIRVLIYRCLRTFTLHQLHFNILRCSDIEVCYDYSFIYDSAEEPRENQHLSEDELSSCFTTVTEDNEETPPDASDPSDVPVLKRTTSINSSQW